jgi:hypothetical protein
MSIPHFTAEASLGNARSALYISRNDTPLDIRDVVVPQYRCGLEYCYCSGFEDCRVMVYGDRICYYPPTCQYSPNGVDCSCVWASV